MYILQNGCGGHFTVIIFNKKLRLGVVTGSAGQEGPRRVPAQACVRPEPRPAPRGHQGALGKSVGGVSMLFARPLEPGQCPAGAGSGVTQGHFQGGVTESFTAAPGSCLPPEAHSVLLSAVTLRPGTFSQLRPTRRAGHGSCGPGDKPSVGLAERKAGVGRAGRCAGCLRTRAVTPTLALAEL